MDLRDFEYFAALVEERNFTRAAERLYTSQPSLSRKISELEHRYGATLVMRSTNRPIELTHEGQVLYRHALHILEECAQLDRDMQEARKGAEETLRVSYGMAGHIPYLTRAAESLRVRCGNLNLRFQRLFNSTALEALESGNCDAAIVNMPEAAQSEWAQWCVIVPCGLCAFVPIRHPLAKQETLQLSDLAGERLMTFERATSPLQYDYLLRVCREAGFEPRIAAHAPDTSTFNMLIELESLIGLMPATTKLLDAELANRLLVRDTHGFDMALVWRKGDRRAGILCLQETLLEEGQL